MVMSSKSRTIVYLLRNDLRIHDNECLSQAIKNPNDRLVPIFCFDPKHFTGTWHFGFPKTGGHRARFQVQSVHDLRSSFQRLGSNLVVRHVEPHKALKDIIEHCKSTSHPVKTLIFQKEVTKEETDVEAELLKVCKEYSVDVKTFWGFTLFHVDDIPYAKRDIPDTYTQFRKGVENGCRIRPVIPEPEGPINALPDGIEPGTIPTLSDLDVEEKNASGNDERSAFPFSGGESSGKERIKEYFWQTDNVSRYKTTRNGLCGKDYSTKFSPWLSNGSLSPRYIHRELKRYESQRTSNESTYWVIFELIWRDYFRFVALKYGDRIFYPGGIMGKKVKWKQDQLAFQKWCDGETGVPFVDANMRELKATGWMSNRGRQNVASFLIKDLELDWRLGAEWFESLLIDHDVCSNYGNWNYSAGIGNDPRENRKFNMIKQALDYDPEGEFIVTWIPELANFEPKSKIHFPWTTNRPVPGYPKPIHVAGEWSRHYGKTSTTGPNSRGRGGGRKSGQQRGIDFYFKKN